jgi:hypothetical protein
MSVAISAATGATIRSTTYCRRRLCEWRLGEWRLGEWRLGRSLGSGVGWPTADPPRMKPSSRGAERRGDLVPTQAALFSS